MAYTEAELKQQIAEHTGDTGVDAVFRLALPLSTLGESFTFSVNGRTTEPVAWNASAEEFQTAIEALDVVGAGNVIVKGMKAGPYLIQFTNELGSMPIEDISADGSTLSPAANLVVESYVPGAASQVMGLINTAWTRYGDIIDTMRRRWYAEVDVLTALRAKTMEMVDTETGDRKEKLSQQFQMLTVALNKAEASLTNYETDTITKYASHTMGRISDTTGNGLSYGSMKYNTAVGRFR